MKRQIFLGSIVASLFAGLAFANVRDNQASTNESSDQPAQQQEAQGEQQGENVSMDQLPAAVRERIQSQEGVAPLRSITRQMVAGKPMYEARFERDNVETRLAVAEDGSPIALLIAGQQTGINEAAGAQRAVAFMERGNAGTSAPNAAGASAQSGNNQQLPAAVQGTLQQQLGNVQVETVKAQQLFDVTLVNQGRRQEVRIAEDGTLLGFRQLQQQQQAGQNQQNQQNQQGQQQQQQQSQAPQNAHP